MAFFEKFSKIRQHKAVRDPMASVLIIARGDGGVPVRVKVFGSSHRFIFLRLGKQAFLDNLTEGACPKDIVITVYHLAVSQGVLSLALVTGILRWRYSRISPEHLPLVSLEGRHGKNHEFSLDTPARRPVRLLTPPRHRVRRIKDRLADPQRAKVRRRVKDRPANPRRIEALAPAGCLPRLDLTKKVLLDRMEKRLHLRRGGQDEVHQPLEGESLMARIWIS